MKRIANLTLAAALAAVAAPAFAAGTMINVVETAKAASPWA